MTDKDKPSDKRPGKPSRGSSTESAKSDFIRNTQPPPPPKKEKDDKNKDNE